MSLYIPVLSRWAMMPGTSFSSRKLKYSFSMLSIPLMENSHRANSPFSFLKACSRPKYVLCNTLVRSRILLSSSSDNSNDEVQTFNHKKICLNLGLVTLRAGFFV